MKKLITIIAVIMGICSQVAEANDEYGGIGALLYKREGRMEIMFVGKGTPADSGGLHMKDVILKIDGKSTKDMSIEAACEALRGKVNSTVIIQFLSLGQTTPREVKLVRMQIDKDKIIWKKECEIIPIEPTGQTPYIESQEEAEKETEKKK